MICLPAIFSLQRATAPLSPRIDGSDTLTHSNRTNVNTPSGKQICCVALFEINLCHGMTVIQCWYAHTSFSLSEQIRDKFFQP